MSAALVLTLGAGVRPTPTATPTISPEDPAMTAVARREFVALQAGDIDKSHYAEVAQSSLTDKAVSSMSKTLSDYGALVRTVWLGQFHVEGAVPGEVGYTFRMECTNATIFEQLAIAPDGKIVSINFLTKLR